MIPRTAHFVFGLREQSEPFHFLHYVSIESCRRMLAPERIYFHHHHLPWGPWWERIVPRLTLASVEPVAPVLSADYAPERVPAHYRYAHHADFIRLDALIEHGGVYADIDTIFVREFPDALFKAPFVIGREPAAQDERTGRRRPSLCNALLMAEPGADFARTWREEMDGALDGSWSNHTGFLSEELSRRMPSSVRVEPQATFFPFGWDRADLARLLMERVELPAGALSVHLWAHLWWERRRHDFSDAHDGWGTPPLLRHAPSTLADLARPYLIEPVKAPRSSVPARAPRWRYLSPDDDSGYGTAADRLIAALEDAGVELEWVPFVNGPAWERTYQPAPPLSGRLDAQDSAAPVVIAHLVPEYLPEIRRRLPDAFLVAHTVWETDLIPRHWTDCLGQADLIVVPSRFSAGAIARSPVRTPVEVVGHVAPLLWDRRAAWPDVPDDVLVFYTIGEWTERKGIARTVEAYLRAFSADDRVVLVIKTRATRDWLPVRSRAGQGSTAWEVARLLARHRNPARVKLITRPLTNAEIGELHCRGDCYVSLCRGEGWGLGAFDATVHGNPVVMTGFGGQLDFLSGSPLLVNYDLVAVEDPLGDPSFTPDQRWAEPDVDHGAALLAQVAQNPREAVRSAGLRASTIRDRFAPESVAAAFRAAVERHLG